MQYYLCECVVQSAETGGPVGKRYISLSMDRNLQYSNVSVASRKFKSVVHTCGDKMEVGWKTGSSANECEFRPMYNMAQKLYNSLIWPTVEFIHKA